MTTPFGNLEQTWRALVRGDRRPEPWALDPIEALHTLADSLCAGRPPDLIILATTKGDCPRWCSDLVSAIHPVTGGPAWMARELGRRIGAPAFALSAACASGTAALAVAARQVEGGGFRRVLVLGGDRPGPFVQEGFASLKVIDPAGCRPFSADRGGLSLGEAYAGILLVPEGPGPRLAGWAIGMDAVHLTGPDRQGRGLARVCASALDQAGGPAPAAIIAHGTGTKANDDAESHAYAAMATGVPVTATKGVLGHTLGAAGLVDTVIACEALSRGRLPGCAATHEGGSAAAINLLPAGEHGLGTGGILVANAGFGGINAAVVVHQGDGSGPVSPVPSLRVQATCRLDATGWTSGTDQGTWSEPLGEGRLPRLTSREITGGVDPTWGRMDLPCRALVALARRLGPLPSACAVVLETDDGCALTDREVELARLAGRQEPQRFAYTLPSTPIGEVSIRCGVTGPGFTLLGSPAGLARTIAAGLLDSGTPAVLLARIETDRLPQVAEADLLVPADPLAPLHVALRCGDGRTPT